MSADSILAEALLRIEFKLDLILKGLSLGSMEPMQFTERAPCPACREAIQFQVDIQQQVVKRVCGCKTGKQPPLQPFIPVPPQPGEANARPDVNPERDEDRPRRQDR
jgi:hypothetical protein